MKKATFSFQFTQYELLPLILGVLLATASVRLAPWGLGLLALVWVGRWWARGYLSRRTPLDWPVGLLLLMVPVTLLVTTQRAVTFLAVSRLLAGISLTYGIVNCAGINTVEPQAGTVRRPARTDIPQSEVEGHFALLTLGLLGAGVGLALSTPLLMDWQPGPLNPISRTMHNRLPQLLSDPLNPNMVAGSLVMLLPFPFVLLWTRRWPTSMPLLPAFVVRGLGSTLLRHMLAGVTLALLLLALLATQSRGGWIAGALVLWVSVALRFPWLWGAAPLGLLMLGWMAQQNMLMPLLDALGTGGAVVGWAERVEIWSRALYMIQDFPFTGIGAGTYQELVSLLYPLFLVGPDKVIPHAHNLLLEVAIDLGLPGLIAFLAIVLLALGIGLRYAWKPPAARRVRIYVPLCWAALASLLGMLLHGIVDATSWIIGWGAPLFWAVTGLLVALDVDVQAFGGVLVSGQKQEKHHLNMQFWP